MFSNNHEISLRQTFRLFTFDFLGISTLIVPGYLAALGGIYGGLAIAAGIGMGLAYLAYLSWVLRRMNTDLFTYMDEYGWMKSGFKKVLCLYFAFSCLITAIDTAVVFTNLIQRSLIREEAYPLILGLMLLVAAYTVSGGIESRARIYEILFWIILIPLFLMLLFALKEMRIEYVFPQKAFDWTMVFRGGYMVFVTWETLFFVLLFPAYVSADTKPKALTKSVRGAFLLAGGILMVLYVILLLTFGENALSGMEFPAVTLMSTVQIAGGFAKRLDAIMMGVWFFTLFALLNLNLHYGSKFLKKALKKSTKEYLPLAVITLLVFLGAMWVGYYGRGQWLVEKYFAWIGMPLYIVLPGILVCRRRKGGALRNEK